MATISFENDLIVVSPKKMEEIMIAMQKPGDSKIKPASPPKLPQNAGALWFKRSGK